MGSFVKRPHALIIEDELLIGLDLQAQLSELGYRSFAFAGAELQAVDQARLNCPDLITVDVGLLDGNGVDAVSAILAECGPVPVLYVTGDREALSRRPDAVVVEKPVDPLSLRRAVDRAKANPARPERSPAARQAAQPSP